MAASRPRDTTLLALAETLMTIDAALIAGDVNPLSDIARDDLATKWTLTAEAMAQIRATSHAAGGPRPSRCSGRLRSCRHRPVCLSTSLCRWRAIWRHH
jgi:hypothetical protein